MNTIHNPILPGFNPDPSVCRVGDTFYIATSTFEWFPGVQIYASEDLVSWRFVGRPLSDPKVLDLRGVCSSGGIWAPCLTYHDNRFYLVFTIVRSWRGETPLDWGAFKDTPNYVVSAKSLDGPWSKPVYLNSSGFDPSLFHDSDGRSWLVNMEWDYRSRTSLFSGILLQEYDRKKGKLFGPITKIFTGSPIGLTEAPHLYKRGDYYYLMVAEGGTSHAHAVTLARSKQISGPYELHPQNPIINSHADRSQLPQLEDMLRQKFRQTPEIEAKLPADFRRLPQKAGHGAMCPINDQDWLLVHLCGRPIDGTYACILGRETCAQHLRWDPDGWPRAIDAQGNPTQIAQAEVRLPVVGGAKTTPQQVMDWSFRDDFEGKTWHHELRSLRIPLSDDASLKARKGWLRLVGRESPVSTFYQTVLATSVKNARFCATTRLDFKPNNFQQMAGLMVRYDERNQFYLRLSYDETKGQSCLGLINYERGNFKLPLGRDEIPVSGIILLKVELADSWLRFWWAPDSTNPEAAQWQRVGPDCDATCVSDEAPWPMGFTGAFVGLACHDLTGLGSAADFDWFSYREG